LALGIGDLPTGYGIKGQNRSGDGEVLELIVRLDLAQHGLMQGENRTGIERTRKHKPK
jgi:hypothetical protein